jgi:hypothetical protein
MINRYLLVLGVVLLVGMASAGHISYEPKLDSGLSRVYCSVAASPNNLLHSLRSAIHANNASYDAQMTTIAGHAATSRTALRNDCNDVAVPQFLLEYRTNFAPTIDAATSLYFRSAFDKVRSGGTTWANVFTQYLGFMTDYQECLSGTPIYQCEVAIA